METVERRRWTQTRRFEFMEWKLFWEGQLNRSDLEATFEMSTPQTSVEVRNYREQAGENIAYDSTLKSFVPTSDFSPKFLKPSADRLLLQLRAWLTQALSRRELWFRSMPMIDMIPDIARHVDADCLRLVFAAMRNRSAVQVKYQSLTNARWRSIAPHALAFDGFRWHVRAWACDREDFRDFVLSRISELGAEEPADYDPADDLEWQTKTVLRLLPHPGLDDDQRLAVERDYNMVDGAREIEVRLSMAYYFIMRMNLDLDDLPPPRAQVRLANIAEVQDAVAQAKALTKANIAQRRTSISEV